MQHVSMEAGVMPVCSAAGSPISFKALLHMARMQAHKLNDLACIKICSKITASLFTLQESKSRRLTTVKEPQSAFVFTSLTGKVIVATHVSARADWSGTCKEGCVVVVGSACSLLKASTRWTRGML